jgi:MoxR-like ATPase
VVYDGEGHTPDLAGQRAELGTKVVGRDRELDLILAAVVAGRDLLLEGPPGTSKSTILRAITSSWGIPLHFVEGNAELTRRSSWVTTTPPGCCVRTTTPTTSYRVRWWRP